MYELTVTTSHLCTHAHTLTLQTIDECVRIHCTCTIYSTYTHTCVVLVFVHDSIAKLFSHVVNVCLNQSRIFFISDSLSVHERSHVFQQHSHYFRISLESFCCYFAANWEFYLLRPNRVVRWFQYWFDSEFSLSYYFTYQSGRRLV